MALINCPECKKEASTIAKICPYCGYNLQNNKKQAQKKKLFHFVFWFFVVVIILGIYGTIHPPKDNNKSVYTEREAYKFTMKYVEKNNDYSIEKQIALLVSIMKYQGLRCEFIEGQTTHLGNDVFSVSVVVYVPDTNERCKYSWQTDMRNKTVVPTSKFAKMLTYP